MIVTCYLESNISLNRIQKCNNVMSDYFFSGVSAVRIRLLDVPQMARVGHTVHLTCDYDLERQRLYQVKWYKGSHEFYRYSPGEPERQKLFLVKNLHVDVSI